LKFGYPYFRSIFLAAPYSLSFLFSVISLCFLGPATDPEAVRMVREGIAKVEDTSVLILNYRKDGSTFMNQLFIAPLCDNHGKVVNFLGVQSLVAPVVERLHP
jgi:hypothetical protein